MVLQDRSEDVIVRMLDECDAHNSEGALNESDDEYLPKREASESKLILKEVSWLICIPMKMVTSLPNQQERVEVPSRRFLVAASVTLSQDTPVPVIIYSILVYSVTNMKRGFPAM
ncbi:hypothetical protein AVEN_218212-1 [Araneus ventricosus]|uniref:Uncharacterized protein n=1 Tax=Araneus ventricosus TaxID=182803 RepID=A0A4Y2QA00_ARAVE|nr:hypothetical protein AVEN_218212-1 [Araneus ventricosus]